MAKSLCDLSPPVLVTYQAQSDTYPKILALQAEACQQRGSFHTLRLAHDGVGALRSIELLKRQPHDRVHITGRLIRGNSLSIPADVDQGSRGQGGVVVQRAETAA